MNSDLQARPKGPCPGSYSHKTDKNTQPPRLGYEEEEDLPTCASWDELNGNDPESTTTQVLPEEASMTHPLPTQSPLIRDSTKKSTSI